MLTGKSKRPLFGSILRRRWKMALSPPLRETEAPSARERKRMLEKDSQSKGTKTVEEPAYPPPIPATALTAGGIETSSTR